MKGTPEYGTPEYRSFLPPVPKPLVEGFLDLPITQRAVAMGILGKLLDSLPTLDEVLRAEKNGVDISEPYIKVAFAFAIARDPNFDQKFFDSDSPIAQEFRTFLGMINGLPQEDIRGALVSLTVKDRA